MGIPSAAEAAALVILYSAADATQACARYCNLHAGGCRYRSIVYKIFLFIEWMVERVNPKFILKTDDDAYVDTAAMVAALRALCISPDCSDER